MSRALNRYSAWDGRQQLGLDADQILSALSEDLMEFGDLQQAMRYLTQRGMKTEDGNHIRGLRDLLQQLKDQRRLKLERFDLSSVIDGLRSQLDEILDMERQTINEWVDKKENPDDARKLMGGGIEDSGSNWQAREEVGKGKDSKFSNQILSDIGERSKEIINNLPEDIAGRIKNLKGYQFLNTDAQKKFLKIIDDLRKAATRSLFKDIQKSVDQMSEVDIKRTKEMIRELNTMLVKKIAGEEPNFYEFISKYEYMFGDPPPRDIDELLEQIRRQMMAAQSLFNSVNLEQQQQLQKLMQGKFGDPELEAELAKLTKELDFLNPRGKQYNFSGDEELDLRTAMDLMCEITDLEQLEHQIQKAQYDGNVYNIDSDKIEKLLGEEVLGNLEEMKKMLRILEKANYVKKEGNKWGLTARGTRSLGQKALVEIYAKLKKQGIGNHAIPEEGRFGERLEESKPYEFGDPFHLNMCRTVRNAIDREGLGAPIKLETDDFEIYRSELITQTATVLMVDLSWSMALRGSFQSAKKVSMALHNLISSTYPRDNLYILGFSAYAKEVQPHDLPYLQYDDYLLGTNIQHSLVLAEKLLAKHQQGTRQVIVITDGEPTAHLEEGRPIFAYPPTATTVNKTIRAVRSCTRKNITINTFMLDQSRSSKSFVEQMSKINGGRIFYAEPHNLGEYVLIDYVKNKKKRIGR